MSRGVVVSMVLASGCSFTTAGNFEECKTDVDCGSAMACSKHYCLPLPAGCRREEAGGRTRAFEEASRIPIVALLPINAASGVNDAEVQSANAMKLAISEVNDRLNPTRGSFGLFLCDTDPLLSDAGLEQQAAWFIDNLHAPALVVSSSEPTLRVAQHASRLDAGTLIVSPNATSPALGSVFAQAGNVWRIAPSDLNQARVVTDLIARDFPDAGARIGILHTRGVDGQSFAGPLAEQLTARGYATTSRAFDADDATSRISALNQLSSDDPAATVFIGGPMDLVPVIERAKTLVDLRRSSGHRWYLTDGVKDPSILTASTIAELELCVGTAPAQGAGGASSAFRAGFRARFGTDPDSTNFVSHSYDATWLVVLAAQYAQGKEADLTRITGPRLGEGMALLGFNQGPSSQLRADLWPALSDALARGTPTNVEGASGPLDFNLDAGFPAAPYDVWQVSDGGIRILRQVSP